MKGDAKIEKREHKTEIEGPYPLPKGWKWVTLGDVAKIVMGQSPPSTTYNKESIGLPFYQGKADFGERYPTPRIWCSKPNKIAEPGDILISVRAPVGPVNLCKDKSCIGRGLAAIRCKNTILNNLFLFYYLRSIESNWKGKGSTFEAIKKRDLENLRIPLPPLEEQKRIVSHLEQLVSRVEETKRLRKSAKEETEKIMQAALHKVFSRAEEEKKWKWVKLRDVLKEDRQTINPQNYPNREFFLITMDCIESDTGKLLKIVKCYGKEIKSTKYVFNTKHILYGKLRPYLNKVYVPNREGICTTEFIPFVVINALREYVAFYLRKKEVVDFAMRHITGTRQPRVIIDELLEYPIPLPPLGEQKNIVASLDKLSKITESLRKLQQSTEEELEQLVPAILDKAFKGRL